MAEQQPDQRDDTGPRRHRDGRGPPGRRPATAGRELARPIPAVTAKVAEERPPANIQAGVGDPASSNAPNT
ncbi:hypothetical protein [Streptomyces canus]|uniref:hypothetical protein n=1 Tax=Streptomyces canus TaxID=58343 RepID=UPI0036E3F205